MPSRNIIPVKLMTMAKDIAFKTTQQEFVFLDLINCQVVSIADVPQATKVIYYATSGYYTDTIEI